VFSGVHLFPSNNQVNDYNLSTVQSKGEPVCVCVAVNSDKKVARVSKKLAGGLDNVICLCIGASVMLTKTIWTNAGHVNGAVGTVVDFIKDASDDTKADVVVVDIPRYRSPPLCGDEPGRRTWVPVQKTKSIWFTGVTCTRSQFPLALAWGVTIHKRFANIVSVRFDT
jgi:ATP-dependent DNA helicase PIF1